MSGLCVTLPILLVLLFALLACALARAADAGDRQTVVHEPHETDWLEYSPDDWAWPA